MTAIVTRVRSAVLAALIAALAQPATAEKRPFQLLVGVSPGASYSDIDGFDYRQGYSLGLGYFWAPRWAAEVRGTLDGYARTGSGERLEAYSLDLRAHYHFFRGRKWGVFSAAGLRYAESDFGHSRGGDSSGAGLLVGLGSELSLSRRFSFRLDLTSVPLDFGGHDHELQGTTLGVGLGWRF